MGFGLDIPEGKVIEIDNTQWIDDNGILIRYDDFIQEQHKERAKKAWETRRQNETIKKENKNKIKKKPYIESYNRTNKNNIRNEITKIIEENSSSVDYYNILTLDSNEFLFCKNINKKHKIFLAENNRDQYFKMIEKKPENVFLYYGDIKDYALIEGAFDVIYLDFCRTFKNVRDSIKALQIKLNTATYIGFTFCLRNNEKKLNDYKFDIIQKIQKTTGLDLLLRYGEAYSDKGHAPMITLFFENKGKHILPSDNTRIRSHIFCKKCGSKYTFEEYRTDNPEMRRNLLLGAWARRKNCNICSKNNLKSNNYMKDDDNFYQKAMKYRKLESDINKKYWGSDENIDYTIFKDFQHFIKEMNFTAEQGRTFLLKQCRDKGLI